VVPILLTFLQVGLLKPDQPDWWLRPWYAVNGTPIIPFHSNGVSLAISDHTVLPATRHKCTHPALTPAKKAEKVNTQRKAHYGASNMQCNFEVKTNRPQKIKQEQNSYW